MADTGSLPAKLKFSNLPEPGDRFKLGVVLGSGVYAQVFEATDQKANGKRVAVKIQTVNSDTEVDLRCEYKILREFSNHVNLPDLYDVYFKKASSKSEEDKLWFVMELCEGGPVTDLVRGLERMNRRMREEHIAYILKEIIKVLVHLHENRVIHRDVKGSNILLTKDGEVKLVDFGLSRTLKTALDKRGTCIGSPCWMAPEVVTSAYKEEDKVYDNRIDVWALGITAIELGDGKAPFQDMHPTRALFQIVRNPPPTLSRPANWSTIYNDFISECLEKNPEHRPYIMELMEHPFITSLPENDFHLSTELKLLVENFAKEGKGTRKTEVALRNGFLRTALSSTQEPMHPEDLAALDKLTEDSILLELKERLKQGHCYTFVGDVLLILNPNEDQQIYGDEFHAKYQFKAQSDNSPHIYSVADRAYQDVLHHEEPQHILLAGETLSGKTTNMLHLLRHLLYLGQSPNKIGDYVDKATSVIHAMGNAGTPTNANSTRHVLQLEITFTSTGKVSGAIFWLYQLEKWRVATSQREQANFHIFYYFYDAMEASNRLKHYYLDSGRKYRYLRTTRKKGGTEKRTGEREDPEGNVGKFCVLEQQLRDLGFQDEQLETLCNLVSAILILGDIKFRETDDREAEIENPQLAANVAQLLGVDEKKFSWALVNYCVIQKGTAVRRRHTKKEAEDARDVLACSIYARLVDWIINVINHKLSFTRTVYGEKYSISLLDMFGFECYKHNSLEQMFVNTLNEQMQYHYNQRVFVWEMQEQEEEEVPVQKSLRYFDNKLTLEEIMSKPHGFFHLLDEASRINQSTDFILESLGNDGQGSRVKAMDGSEFSVAHYTGKVSYDARDMVSKNRDFLPPEMVDALRISTDKMVKLLFSNQLSRTGNLIMSADDCGVIHHNKNNRWGAALAVDNESRAKKFLSESQGQFSQTREMRTAATMYRSASLAILRGLAVGSGSGGTHFVRCIRADVTGRPRGFQPEVVRQQLRALAVLETAQARKKGFSHRVPFPEFIRRYKFLAFDFDETVDVTKDNSRLLLVRLKMEGWVIGKSKVFLKYYNEEYLARLYENQVKKIVKVQTMMRAFLAKRRVASRLLKTCKTSGDSVSKTDKKPNHEFSEEEASLIIQKQYRGYRVRKDMGPMRKRKLDVNTAEFIREYCRRWKAKTIFQVLLMYRAARQQDLIYFSQQVHLYNQTVMNTLTKINMGFLSLDSVECGARASLVLGKRRPTVWKLPFRLDEDLTYFDTSFLSDPMTPGTGSSSSVEEDLEAWDAPLRRGHFMPWKRNKTTMKDKEVQTGVPINPEKEDTEEDQFISMPFCRDPTKVPSGKLPSKQDVEKKSDMHEKSNQKVSSEESQQKESSHELKQKPISDESRQKPTAVPSPIQQQKFPKNSASKRPEVYNPGKARRLEQRQEIDNRSWEWETSSVLNDNVPKCNQINSSSPTPQQSNKYYDNKNSQNIENMMPRRYPGDNNWGSTSPILNRPIYNVKNEYNRQRGPGVSSQSSSRGSESHYSSNPIAEMELKGRKQSKDESDEPPFNFQAMLRKTNTNRASLRRAHNTNITEVPIKETTEQQCNKNSQTNDGFTSRSSSILYNSSSRSKHTSPSSTLSRSDSKKSWHENEQWGRPEPKKGWNENERDSPSSQKSWNESGKWGSSDSKKSWYENEQWSGNDSKKLQPENEAKDRPDSQTSWRENEESRSESRKSCIESELPRSDSRKSYSENYRGSDSKKSDHENEQHRPEFRKSCSENEKYDRRKSFDENELRRSDSKKSYIENDSKKSYIENENFDSGKSYNDNEQGSAREENYNNSCTENEKINPMENEGKKKEEKEITTTELVPGLIIQGQVADL